MLASPAGEMERAMKRLVLMGFAAFASSIGFAQSTIYKHVDEQGRVTYSNVPIKGAAVLDLDPLTTIPGIPGVRGTSPSATEKPATTADSEEPAAAPKAPPVLAERSIKPQRTASVSSTSYPNVDGATQRKRDDVRRRILEEELRQEEKMLNEVRGQLTQEQQNPALIQAVRLAQEATQPTPAQQLEIRRTVDKASAQIRSLQQTAGQHEKNLEAIRKEISSLRN
jgi:hypothetical protein